MPLTINSSETNVGRVLRVDLVGSLDTQTAPALDVELTARVRPGLSMLVLDMKSLDYISSAGLRVIFKAAKTMRQHGGKLALANRQPQIVKVFDIVKALPDLAVFRDDREMDDYLSDMQDKTLRGEI